MPTAADLALKAIAIIVSALFSWHQARNFLPGRRAQLKLDLEILNLLDEKYQFRQSVQNQVDQAVQEIYGKVRNNSEPKFHIFNVTDLLTGLVMLPAFSYWTYKLLANGFNGWSVATGFMALAGVGAIGNAFDPSRAKHKGSDAAKLGVSTADRS